MKALSIGIVFSIFSLIFFPPFYNLNSQTMKLSKEKVSYNLPYPGLLPDHPLYFLKTIRDRIWEFTTRDSIKKAELYLLFSDKHAAASLSLAQKGKDKQAVETVSKAETYPLKSILLIITAKKQGSSPTEEFIQKLRLSNQKHREIIKTLLKELPQGQNQQINEVLNANQTIKKRLEKF